MDFVHDQLAAGRKLRILTVVDTHSRFCPTTDPRFSYRGEDVVQTLEQVCGQVGYPKTIRVDNSSEFISRDMDLWAYANDVTLDFSRPAARQLFACEQREGGKPTDNVLHTLPGSVCKTCARREAFNSKFRTECLNGHGFMTLADARKKLETWPLSTMQASSTGQR